MNVPDMMRFAIGQATKIVEGGEQALPVFFAEDRDGHLRIVMCPWRDDETKDHVLTMLRILFVHWGVKKYVQLSEAWFAAVNGADDPLASVMPSKRPDRMECLMCIGVEQGKPTRSALAEIKRDTAGKAIVEEPKCDPYEPGAVAGRMAEMLPPSGLRLPPAIAAKVAEMECVLASMGFEQFTRDMPNAAEMATVREFGHA
jgi:hypothetical protein